MKDYFEKKSLLFIDANGNSIVIPKVEGERDHKEAYTRVSNIYPQLMKDYNIEESTTNGLVYASYISSKNVIVVWPSSLEEADFVIVTLPERITNIQGEQLQLFLKEQKIYDKYSVLATISTYTGNEDEICWKVLSEDETTTKEKINEYIKIQKKLNAMSTETTDDIRKTR